MGRYYIGVFRGAYRRRTPSWYVLEFKMYSKLTDGYNNAWLLFFIV